MFCEITFCIIAAGSAMAHDGDTFFFPERIDGGVRLYGLNVVEKGEEGDEAATAALQELISGEMACLFRGWSFSRRVMQCWTTQGVDVSCEMIRQGHGQPEMRHSKGYYAGCGE